MTKSDKQQSAPGSTDAHGSMETPRKLINRILLSLVASLGLILVLVLFSDIAGDVLTVIGVITSLAIFLFPGLKTITQYSWFQKAEMTVVLSLLLVVQLIYGTIVIFQPGNISLRIVRLEGERDGLCKDYCIVVLEGKGISTLKPGANLSVFGPQARLVNGTWSESPIALLKLISSSSDIAFAQVVLVHERFESDQSRKLAPGLRVTADNGFAVEYLIPAYGDGYIYKDLLVFLSPKVSVNVGDRLVIIEPQFKGERIIDYQITNTELRVISIGQEGVSVQTNLISGKVPASGDVVVKKSDQGIPRLPFEPEMVLIPSSSFEMGSNNEKNEEPVHVQTISDFYISKTEVTNGQFRPFIEDDGYQNKKYWTEDGWAWREKGNITQPKYWEDPLYYGDNQPVVGISWHEAWAYTRWLSSKSGRFYRMPTEAEWERTACGVPKREYPWGNTWNSSMANFADGSLLKQEPSFQWADSFSNDGYAFTAPVGSFLAGSTPEGVLDLAGNVWEWTSSLYKDYPYSITDGREEPLRTGDRVTRGGGWGSESIFLKCTVRSPQPSNYQTFIVGFRLAREP